MKPIHRSSVAASTCLAALCLVSGPSTAQLPSCVESAGNGYVPVPLTGVQGVTYSASALNNAGEVAGELFPDTVFLWSDGLVSTHTFANSVINVMDVTEDGRVLGTVRPVSSSVTDTFVWDSRTDTVDIVVSPVPIVPAAFNEDGLIVGIEAEGLYGFVLDPDTADLEVIAFGDLPKQGVGTAGTTGINDAGLVVGAEVVFDDEGGFYVELPYRWTESGGIEQLEVVPGGFGGAAFDVAANGNAAGIVLDEFFTRSSALWTDGGDTLVNLGSPFGYFVSDALGLNVHDQVIVVAPNDFFGFTRGFVWEDGLWTDLSCFSPPGTAVTRPLDINDAGEILVQLVNVPGSQTIVDTIVLRPERPFLAAVEVSRVGTPPNPEALLPGVTSGPVLGQTWDPVVDHTTFMPTAALDFLAVAALPANVPAAPFGTVLCDAVLFTVASLPGVPFAIALPADPTLAGVQLCGQGASWNGAGMVRLTNALDVLLGAF